MPINAKHHTLRLTPQNVTSIEATSGRYKWNVNKTINRLITAGAALLNPKKATKVWLETRNTIIAEGTFDKNASGMKAILTDAKNGRARHVSK